MKKFYALFIFALITTISVNAQNLIQDPGFEAGTSATIWDTTSSNFGTPFCDLSTCGNCGGPCIPHAGSWFVWIGGIAKNETASVSQHVTIPTATSATLKFWYTTPIVAANGADYLKVYIDNNVVWSSTNADSSLYKTAYTEITVNVTPYANGQQHTFKIAGFQSGTPGVTNMLVDDITLTASGVGIYESYLDEGITVYPNPTTDVININFEKQASSELVVYLYDINGKKVFEQKRGNNNISIDVSNFNSGNYFLRIGDEKQNIVVKTIIVK